MALLKKIISITIALTMLFEIHHAAASETVGKALASIALSAQHCYDTSLAQADMLLSRESIGCYKVYHVLEDGTRYCVDLDLKEWGTWNLGDMNFVKEGSEKVIVGGSTDWEYALRIFNPINQAFEFTGGNHGSEKLISVKMYDDATDEEILLSPGETKNVRRLKVEEDTQLLISGNELLPYANVRREYTFVGTTVSLDCKIEFIRDMQMALSYSAMASVNKDFGRYCTFDDGNYAIANAKGSCSKQYLGETASTVCTLSGDDPSATLTVGILNAKDMTDNFSNENKTFLWDMSEDYTKLYFSKYKMSAENIAKGTVWSFAAFWRTNFN